LSGHLGYSITPVPATNVSMNIGETTQIVSSGTLTYGTWLIIGYVSITGTTVAGTVYAWIGDNTVLYANRKTECQMILGSGDPFVSTLSYVGTGTGPFLLVAQANGSNSTGEGKIYCTRIA